MYTIQALIGGVSEGVVEYREDNRLIATAKLERLRELETRKRGGGLDAAETRERLQLRSSLRRLDPEMYQQFRVHPTDDPKRAIKTRSCLPEHVRESSRKLVDELREVRAELSALNKRRHRLDQIYLHPPLQSSAQHDPAELERWEILGEIDRIHQWLATKGLFDEVVKEIRYLYVLKKRFSERRLSADAYRAYRRSKGLVWPRHWETEFQRILSELRNLDYRISQKKILIARCKSGGWY